MSYFISLNLGLTISLFWFSGSLNCLRKNLFACLLPVERSLVFEGTNKAKILLIITEGGIREEILSGQQQELWHWSFLLRGDRLVI